ncbi:uncharacterized protein K460DRAFT_401684 [Cucurbitaria berberidis CBS 394.84]|uniref:Uncharacterized protein n=1 Tax=Cucurbitaria berberidis CBS 394.84 TaxID=1168544 RepID=A0A9P4GUQ1_9PLEO|nr:uncharacterized protein K460DRAFT_401684 [Cucurbitaria berberidis CBS 394.84]KAF1851667.1 hypothetical protein K460DRAFT_401684 [Cucurbitaria berberidis CBS 394.84]
MNPPPPLYTEYEANLRDREPKAVLLHRFLIDNLAFSHNVDPKALRTTISTTPIASTNAAAATVSSILSQHEQASILRLATIVAQTYRQIERQQISCIRNEDLLYIYKSVHVPATNIEINPNFMLSILRDYLKRRNDPSKQSRTRHGEKHIRLRRPISWPSWWDQHNMEKSFISDDVLIGRIAPNEEIRLLIGSAIARGGNDYLWSWSNVSRIKRDLYWSQSIQFSIKSMIMSTGDGLFSLWLNDSTVLRRFWHNGQDYH